MYATSMNVTNDQHVCCYIFNISWSNCHFFTHEVNKIATARTETNPAALSWATGLDVIVLVLR